MKIAGSGWDELLFFLLFNYILTWNDIQSFTLIAFTNIQKLHHAIL